MAMVFNRYVSDVQDLLWWLDQECLLLGIACQFYNVDLLEVKDEKKGKETVDFLLMTCYCW